MSNYKYMLIITGIFSLMMVSLFSLGTIGITGSAIRGGNTCFDSDGGINSTIQGKVSGTLDGAPFSYTDACIEDGNSLNEFYCDDHYKHSRIIKCECVNGVCLE